MNVESIFLIEKCLKKLSKDTGINQWCIAKRSTRQMIMSSYFDYHHYPLSFGIEDDFQIRLISNNRYCSINVKTANLHSLENIILYGNHRWKTKCFSIPPIFKAPTNILKDENIDLIFNSTTDVSRLVKNYSIEMQSIKKFRMNIYLEKVESVNYLNKVHTSSSTGCNVDFFTEDDIIFHIVSSSLKEPLDIRKVYDFFQVRNKTSYANKISEMTVIFNYSVLMKILKEAERLNIDGLGRFSNLLVIHDESSFLDPSFTEGSNFSKSLTNFQVSNDYIDEFVYITDISNVNNIDFKSGEFKFICKNAVVFKDNKPVSILNVIARGNIYKAYSSNKFNIRTSITNGSKYYDLAIASLIYSI